jgi:EpsI family protein
MADKRRPLSFLSKSLIIVTALLIGQALVLRAVSRPEVVTPPPPLSLFPSEFEGWRMAQEGVVEQEVRDVLQADDLLNRTYARDGSRLATSFFVAMFLSQRNGKAPHSPKNCLPGAGWVQQESEILPVEVPGVGTIEVNHYVIANREYRSDVMYWYQSRNRVVASEYRAKMFVIADAIRYNRTDTALVRIITPIVGDGEATAKAANIDFIRSSFPMLQRFMPM